MRNLLLPVLSPDIGTLLPAAFGVLALLTVGLSSSAFAREVRALVPINATAAREFPQAVFDRITAKITRLTTFQQLSPEGAVRSGPRTIKLVDFVKAPSPTYPDTYLYAMRYVVSVIRDKDTLGVYGCQVTVVYKYDEYSEPTASCQPVGPNLPPLEG
jgi:hypothetical protein